MPELETVAFEPRYAARQAAIGSLWVWAVTAALVGLLAGPSVAAIGLLCGSAFGWAGGAACGWIAALAVRREAPRLAARELRWMGVQWALGTVLGGALAAGAGAWILGSWEAPSDATRPPFVFPLESCFEILALLVLVLALIPVGFLLGTGLMAGLLRRRMGLAPDRLGRWQVWAVGVAWGLTGVITGLLVLFSTAWLTAALGLAA